VSDEIDQESELVVPSVEDGAHEREADGQRAEEDLRRRHVALGLLLVAADHRDGEDQKEGAKELDQERRDRAQMMQKVVERVPAASSLRADGHGDLLVACCLRERARARERERERMDRKIDRDIVRVRHLRRSNSDVYGVGFFACFACFALSLLSRLLSFCCSLLSCGTCRSLACCLFVVWFVVWRRYDYKHVYA